MKFSEKLQKLRKDNNLSQEQLADKLDVSRQSVSKWESGQTYPEMDKLLTMCKIFNVTLDDLTNDEIKYNDVRTKNTNAFSNLIDDLVYIIDKSFSMFKNMSSKTRGKVIGELIVLFIILLLFRMPFSYIEDLGYTLGYSLPRGGITFTSLWSFIINTIYLVLFIFTYLYIYKTHYLDKYKETTKEENIKTNEKVETSEKIEKEYIKEENHQHKEKHREPSHFGGTLFTVLSKLSSFCIKGFLAFMLIPFIITLISIFLCGTIMFGLLFKGIIYFGIILLLIAGAILNIVLIKAIISFIFNIKTNARILLILFLTGLAITGIGSGLTVIELASTEFIDEAPKSNYELISKSYEYQITDKLIFPHNRNIEMEIDESLTDNVKVEVTYYKDLMKVQLFEEDECGFDSIEIWASSIWNKNIIELFLDNLKEKKIYNYEQLYNYKITLYTSSNNIERLKNNTTDYEKAINERIEYYYNNEIDELNNQIYYLENKIEELNNYNQDLEEENTELKEKIEDYKNNLQNLLD